MPATDLFLLILIGILAIIIMGLAIGVVMLLRARKLPQENNAMSLMQQQVDALRQQVQTGMESNTQFIQQQFGQILQSLQQSQNQVRTEVGSVNQLNQEIREKLGKMDEANRQIIALGKDISSLQELLSVPKLRGGLGEFFLEELLRQILPPQYYQTQYLFGNRERVDAVIYLGEKMVPVDSKFPLESFRRMAGAESPAEKEAARKEFQQAVKTHIQSIADKYIRPAENTYDFALMYIPAENVYYETILQSNQEEGNKNLMAIALQNKVIPVSPNSFYAYLQTILMGLKGFQLEKRTQEILGQLQHLQKEFTRFQEDFEKLGKQLNTINKTYGETERRAERFSERMELVTGFHPEIEASPQQESDSSSAK
jgi:DNA recombination protein RmuC